MNLFNVYPRFDINLTRAQGVYVFDDKGEKYLDLYGGHGVVSIGHNHSNYIQKITEQLGKIGFYSNSINIPLQNELAKKLKTQSNYVDHQLFLCNSGAEANENAIKLASFHTGKKSIIAFKKSFHGRTAAALNITDYPKLSAPINKRNFNVDFIELNNEKAVLESLQSKDVCAIIVEGIQGVGGLDEPSKEFLKFLKQSCETYGALLILDEIQSGFVRSGEFFAHQIADIQADLVTMAKGMGNGFPIGGVLIDPKIQASYGLLGTTFGGNYLACAASISVLDTLKNENIKENVRQQQDFLTDQFKTISQIKQIKGRGLMLGIVFDFHIQTLRMNLLKKHRIFTGSSANPNVLRILPPLCITSSELSPLISALKQELV